MTNFEKYKDELKKLKHKFAVGLDGNVADCSGSFCSKCIFSSENACDEVKIDWLFNEYKKKNIEASTEEKALVEAVGIAKNVKYRYIARDEEGWLYLYDKTPSKDGDIYILKEGRCFEIYKKLFPWIHSEDGAYDIETGQFINVE